MLAAGIDWTQVMVALIAAVPSTIAAVGVIRLRRDAKPPSGGTIGERVEQAHDLVAVNTVMLQDQIRREGGKA